MTAQSDTPAVLVVEDEPLIRSLAADSLLDAGITHYEAADADEALALLDAHRDIAVVFTDVNMPGPMDGLGLAKQVHKRRPDVALIVTSGRAGVADRDLPDTGTFLPKPYRLWHMLEVVGEKLRRAGRRHGRPPPHTR